MRIFQNNFIVLLGTFVVLCTATIRSINPDPNLVWLGSIGVLVFALSAVGQIVAINVRMEELQNEVDALRARIQGTKPL